MLVKDREVREYKAVALAATKLGGLEYGFHLCN